MKTNSRNQKKQKKQKWPSVPPQVEVELEIWLPSLMPGRTFPQEILPDRIAGRTV